MFFSTSGYYLGQEIDTTQNTLDLSSSQIDIHFSPPNQTKNNENLHKEKTNGNRDLVTACFARLGIR